MQEIHPTERAYARLVVAIVADPYLSGSVRDKTIDALVERLTGQYEDTHTHTFGMPCEVCDPHMQDGKCIHPGVFAGTTERVVLCHYCNTLVSVSEL